jgi:hypothetical protein
MIQILFKSRGTLFALFLSPLFLFWGCENELDDPGTLSDVQPTFRLDMFEELGGNEPSFFLQIATIEEKECLNYSIDYSFSQATRILDLSLNDIQAPADCLPGSAPAQEAISVGQLENGIYTLYVQLKNTVNNEGQLIVSDNAFELYFNNPSGVLPVRERLFRIPERTVWGWVGSELEGQDSLAQQFLQDLASISPTASDWDTGFYGYFSIKPDGSVSLRDVPTLETYWPVVQRYSNSSEIHALVDDYRQYFPNLVIELRDDRGEVY